MLRVAVLALVSSCSFALTNTRPPCSSVAPIADTAIATLAAIGLVYFATEGDELGVVVEGALVAGFATSAYVGFRRTARCKAVHAPR